jgi:hypothetical protein
MRVNSDRELAGVFLSFMIGRKEGLSSSITANKEVILRAVSAYRLLRLTAGRRYQDTLTQAVHG